MESCSGSAIVLVPLITRNSFLVDQSHVILASEEYKLACLCLGYLNFRCFDGGLSESEIRAFVWKGYYSFLDYAAVYWLDHLEQWAQKPSGLESQTLITKLLESFLQKHWPKQQPQIAHPKKIHAKLSLFEDSEFFNQLIQAAVLWRKQLTSYGAVIADSESSNILEPIIRMRSVLETIASSSTTNDILRRNLTSLFGPNLYKCSRVSCNFFAEGFSSKLQCEAHKAKHERPFTCIEISCPFASLGFTTSSELNRHMVDSHHRGWESCGIHYRIDDKPRYPITHHEVPTTNSHPPPSDFVLPSMSIAVQQPSLLLNPVSGEL